MWENGTGTIVKKRKTSKRLTTVYSTQHRTEKTEQHEMWENDTSTIAKKKKHRKTSKRHKEQSTADNIEQNRHSNTKS